MRLGFIGAGGLATALARQLGARGHEAMLSYSRDAGRLAAAAAAVGARSGTPAEAAEFGDVIVLAVPWTSVPDALAQAGDLGGKVLWDCTNPLTPDMRGLVLGTTTSGGEEVARLAFRARVVKGIPPFAELLASGDPTVAGRPAGVFVAGDDEAAKRTVEALLAELPAQVSDAGTLDAARLIEPAMSLLVRLAYLQGLGPRIALDLAR